MFGFYHLDITVIFCIGTTASLELSIQSGLILTNNGYDELFQKSGLCAIITDKNFSKIISSDGCRDISEENMRKAVNSPVIFENGIRLSSAQLKYGYVFWQEDISEMKEIVQKLSETNDYLQGKNSAIQQACGYKKRNSGLLRKTASITAFLPTPEPKSNYMPALRNSLPPRATAPRKGCWL